MKEAAEGHLTTEALNWNQDNQKTISGMVYIFFCSHFNIALIERISWIKDGRRLSQKT